MTGMLYCGSWVRILKSTMSSFGFNQVNAANKQLHSTAYALRVNWALVGSALVFFGGWVLMALAESWEQNRQHGGVAKALKSVVLLAAQSASAVGNNVSVPVVGLSAGKRFLAYLLLCCSGS